MTKGKGKALSQLHKQNPQLTEAIIEAVQKYINKNSIYQVELGHYEGLYTWVPIKTKKVNLRRAML